ncbi:hypothetical protein BDF21DRAFT_404776 [Thamnidium elegans]|nr:hypothetical protein BDF21DRAFT_404776 [Thamnidium elegans]
MSKAKNTVFIYFKYKPTREEKKIHRSRERVSRKRHKEQNCIEKRKKITSRRSEECIPPLNITQRSSEGPLRLGNGMTRERFDFNDNDPFPEDFERSKTTWEEDLNRWVSLYLRALGRGKPSAMLTTPEAISKSCACPKKERTMSLYMLHGKIQNLEECPDQIVLLHWRVTIKNILDSRDINKGLSYLYRIFPSQIKKNYFFCFKILEHILNLLSNYDEMLVKDSDSTENDYIRIVRSEILEQLFRPKCNVKVITGETVNPISTLNRKERYGDSATKDEANKTIGFKIDIRLVYNKSTGGCPSIDLCAGEAAKDESFAKTIGDRSKVSREAKDNLDLLLTILPSSMSQYCVGWSLLITGITCSISCLYLDANGLYVNIPKYDFSLPTTILELSGTIDILKRLLTLRREIYFMADIIQSEMAKPPSIINPLE